MQRSGTVNVTTHPGTNLCGVLGTLVQLVLVELLQLLHLLGVSLQQPSPLLVELFDVVLIEFLRSSATQATIQHIELHTLSWFLFETRCFVLPIAKNMQVFLKLRLFFALP